MKKIRKILEGVPFPIKILPEAYPYNRNEFVTVEVFETKLKVAYINSIFIYKYKDFWITLEDSHSMKELVIGFEKFLEFVGLVDSGVFYERIQESLMECFNAKIITVEPTKIVAEFGDCYKLKALINLNPGNDVDALGFINIDLSLISIRGIPIEKFNKSLAYTNKVCTYYRDLVTDVNTIISNEPFISINKAVKSFEFFTEKDISIYKVLCQ